MSGKGGERMASILSDALHFLFERLEAEICVFRATFKVTERESVDLQPPTPPYPRCVLSVRANE